jgi:DNA-binding transcriptional LysR family regulator
MRKAHDLLLPVLPARLGLVVALDALLSARSVSGAAAACGMTQSGMSHALAELRRLLGDELLVRSGNTMRLTPRAQGMAAGLRRGLLEIERAFGDGDAFDPARAERLIRIGTSDAAAVTIIPRLMDRARRAAPRLRWEVRPLHLADAPAQLETGELDLLVTAQVPDRPGLLRATLYQEELVCVLRRGHPALRRAFDLEAYLALEHALITTGAPTVSAVDRHLDGIGRSRRVALRIGYFLAAPQIIAQSDLVLTMPARPAAALSHGLALRPLPLPVRGGPVSMVWHERFKDDPASRWLRAELLAAAREGARASSPVRS